MGRGVLTSRLQVLGRAVAGAAGVTASHDRRRRVLPAGSRALSTSCDPTAGHSPKRAGEVQGSGFARIAFLLRFSVEMVFANRIKVENDLELDFSQLFSLDRSGFRSHACGVSRTLENPEDRSWCFRRASCPTEHVLTLTVSWNLF